MIGLEKVSVEEAIDLIELRRDERRIKLEERNRLAMELISLGRLKEAKRLIEKSTSEQLTMFARAEDCENCGEIEEAAKLYWHNIFMNGADASANFKRLMNILERLEKCDFEMKVAKIYLHFADRYESGPLEHRIEELKSRLASV
ncbi:MAG: hypothetical protein KAX13_11605 [Candidatus Krumholzibacteria bacterium]|nr:hypothetical protein [Candidatus Krumholzibacteria bacterium]